MITSLEHFLLERLKGQGSLVRIINTSVFSRVLLISTAVGNIILKICVITPEVMELSSNISSSSHKRSVSRADFVNEYQCLLDNSRIGISPRPHFIDMYDYHPVKLPPIFSAIQTSLKQEPNPRIARALHDTFKDMKKLKEIGVPVSYGIIGMEYIEGSTLIDHYDEIREPEQHRVLSQKVCISLLLFHMNGYANIDCHSENILVRQGDNQPFLFCTLHIKKNPATVMLESTNKIVPYIDAERYQADLNMFFQANQLIKQS
jgi:hypothetical protein